MKTNKLIEKLEEFFDYPKKKQRKKHEKLVKIISKLKSKKSKVESELVELGQQDLSSDRYHELIHELKVVCKLIEKADGLVQANSVKG